MSSGAALCWCRLSWSRIRAWVVIGPLFPAPKATGRPPVDRRTVVEATAWRLRTGAPWRDLALRERGVAATIPERDDQIAHRRKRPGRPIDFGDEQRERLPWPQRRRGCFNRLKQWRAFSRHGVTASRRHGVTAHGVANRATVARTCSCIAGLPLWPASSKATSSAPGQAWANLQAASNGQLRSSRP